MQKINWSDLRYLLALSRTRKLSGAARCLGVDDTTVSRRLKSLQRAAGVDLYHRASDGAFQLTQAGDAVVEHIERIELETFAIDQVLGREMQKVTGTVRITSVPCLVNSILVPSIQPLLKQHPNLIVELVPDSKEMNLTRREADVAIRLARPQVGGTNVLARRIGLLHYGIFVSKEANADNDRECSWITYDDTMSFLPQAKWLNGQVKSGREAVSGLRVADTETAIEAIASGMGKALLPSIIGQNDQRLRQITFKDDRLLPQREIWILIHAQQKGLSNIQTVVDWICSLKWNES